MHSTSAMKMAAFLQTYAPDCRGKTVLDIGSQVVIKNANSYKIKTDHYGLVYTGLDFEEGHNVDLVPANPYIWAELEDEKFDFVISGQAFEHNPFMWITFAEIARVLKPGGMACIIAPSAGPVHRYPYDCWRYYPDSWAALCALTGLTLTESIREPKTSEAIRTSYWTDSACIATKPALENLNRDPFYANLAEITAPFRARRYDFAPAEVNKGPWFDRYITIVDSFVEKQVAAKAQKAASG